MTPSKIEYPFCHFYKQEYVFDSTLPKDFFSHTHKIYDIYAAYKSELSLLLIR